MRLCDYDIEIWLNQKKLVISPYPSKKQINGATVDIRLGNKFRIFSKKHDIKHIDLGQPKKEIDLIMNKIMSKEIQLDKGGVFFLHPGELALGLTLETFTLPDNLIGWIDGRSSLARLGLMVHITAHRIDPGWKGRIVLEFFNSGKLTLILHPGMLIGALSFEILSGHASRPYNQRKNAKYQKQSNIISYLSDKH